MGRQESQAGTEPLSDIAPLDGWEPQGPYGLQRFNGSPGGRLLRLDEVLYWMGHALEWPRRKAIYAVFSHLIQLDEADPPHQRMVLYIVNGEGYAEPLAVGDKLNPKARDFWGKLSYEHPGELSYGVAREIAELWQESWPGYSQHTDEFYRVGWMEYCKHAKKAAVARDGAIQGEEEYRTRYHMSLEEWKQRCAKAVFLLGRVAVPFSVAHELWGWGTLVKEAPASPFPLADWQDLLAYRNANPGVGWDSGNQIAVGKTELESRRKDGKTESTALAEMAGELSKGSRQSLRKALFSVRKRTKKAVPDLAVTEVRDGKVKNRKAA